MIGYIFTPNVGVQYQFDRNVGIGCGSKWFSFDVVEDKIQRVDASMDFNFIGPGVNLAYTF